MSRVAVLLAHGFEEIEAVTVIDVLRRAQVSVDVLGVEELIVNGSHDITITADLLLKDQSPDSYDYLILPGGMPASNTLRDSPMVQDFILAFQNKKIAAVCAAPIALERAGLIKDKKVTSHPSVKDVFVESTYCEDRVVKDSNIITSRGAGTTFEFAEAILCELGLAEEANKWREAMIY